MQVTKKDNIFLRFVEKESIFKNKKALTSSFMPSKIPHREEEIKSISNILAPALRGYQPSNLFIYGTVGTGKTISIRYVLSQLEEISKGRGIRTVYINCKMKKVSDTEYRLLAQLLKEIGEFVPETGLPTHLLYRRFFEKIDEKKQTIILVLDEIDSLYKKIGDDFLYNLTRVNGEMKNATITLVGITNDLSFRDNLDARIKSSLSDEEIIFKPYDALQLKDILAQRVSEGVIEDTISEEIISMCAAMAAQEHGDARRAIDLLRVAGEVAERLGDSQITYKHVELAEEKIDMDRVTETIKLQPKQSQAVMYSIIKLQEKYGSQKKWADTRMLTGDIYEMYKEVCARNNLKTLTQRRVSDLIGELDMLGVITAKVISKGRYGRTREVVLAINDTILQRVNSMLVERLGN